MVIHGLSAGSAHMRAWYARCNQARLNAKSYLAMSDLQQRLRDALLVMLALVKRVAHREWLNPGYELSCMQRSDCLAL